MHADIFFSSMDTCCLWNLAKKQVSCNFCVLNALKQVVWSLDLEQSFSHDESKLNLNLNEHFTLPCRSLWSVRFLHFLKKFCNAHQGCIYLIKKKNKKKISVFCFNIFFKCNLFLWCKAEFSVFSIKWSFRNHADVLLKKHFLLLSMLKTVNIL